MFFLSLLQIFQIKSLKLHFLLKQTVKNAELIHGQVAQFFYPHSSHNLIIFLKEKKFLIFFFIAIVFQLT